MLSFLVVLLFILLLTLVPTTAAGLTIIKGCNLKQFAVCFLLLFCFTCSTLLVPVVYASVVDTDNIKLLVESSEKHLEEVTTESGYIENTMSTETKLSEGDTVYTLYAISTGYSMRIDNYFYTIQGSDLISYNSLTGEYSLDGVHWFEANSGDTLLEVIYINNTYMVQYYDDYDSVRFYDTLASISFIEKAGEFVTLEVTDKLTYTYSEDISVVNKEADLYIITNNTKAGVFMY